jgi:3-hydroxybutyrate dehydrogenase
MHNKVVLITGSTSGIGFGIAEKFAAEGFDIIFNGLEKEGPEIAANIATKYNVKTIYSAADMQKPDEIKLMIKQSEDAFGKIDVLVNNAGIQFVSPVEDFPDEKWNAIIDINLNACFYTSKAVWKGMKERKHGKIINISSAHGLIASEFKSAYVAAKHGLIGLTKALALEGAGFGLTVNAICPGYVKTPLVDKQIAELANAHHISEEKVINTIMLSEQAIKEFTSISAIADLAFYLTGEQSKTITGASFAMDGGWTAH